MLPSELFEAARLDLGPNYATAVTTSSETGKITLSIALPIGKWSVHPIGEGATPENAAAAWGLLAGVAYLEMMQLQEELLVAYMTQLPRYGTKPEKYALSALTAYFRVGKHLTNALKSIIDDGPERDAAEEAAREADAHESETARVANADDSQSTAVPAAPETAEPAPVDEPTSPGEAPAPEPLPVPAEPLPIAS